MIREEERKRKKKRAIENLALRYQITSQMRNRLAISKAFYTWKEVKNTESRIQQSLSSGHASADQI